MTRIIEADSSRSRLYTLVFLAACGTAFTSSVSVSAQCKLGELPGATQAPGDSFGLSMSLDEDHLAVGGLYAAVVYRRFDPGTPFDPTDDEWAVEDVLLTPQPSSNFGKSVSLGGRHLIVGAPRHGSGLVGNGAAFVYRRQATASSANSRATEWILEAKIVGQFSPGVSPPEYGESTAICPGFAAVGAPAAQPSVGEPSVGLAFVYRHDDGGTPANPADDAWISLGILAPSDAEGVERFGQSMTFAGNDLLIGAVPVFDGSAVYHFRHEDGGTPGDPSDDSWFEHSKIEPPPAPLVTRFGISISVDDDRMLIGSIGAAFEYRLDDAGTPGDSTDDEWVYVGAIVSPDQRLQEEFGRSVSLSGDAALIGAPFHDAYLGATGAAYEFRRAAGAGAVRSPADAWTLVTRIDTFDTDDFAFGYSVLLAGDHAFVSQKGIFFFLPSILTYTYGKVYVYARPVAPWRFVDALSAGPMGSPCLLATGAMVPGEPARVLLRHATASAPAALVIGGSAVNQALKGGILVPSPDRVLWTTTSGGGEVTLGGDWPVGIPSGFALFLQAWVVKPAVPMGFSYSNGVSGITP